jgi:aspartate/methionine/tyrosine aminotransferase
MDYETPQFFRVMKYAADADHDVVGMANGSPDWEPPTALREGLREYADAEPDEFQYPPSVGLRELREEFATRRGVDQRRIVITNGTGEANHLAMAGGLETMPGDEILLADPVYPYYAGRGNYLGAETTFVPVGADGHLDPAAVRDRASHDTAVIVVNSPNNPMGVTYSAETIEALVAVAEAYNAILVSDEVYDHFDYSGRFSSALSVDSDNYVVTNAVSKSMAVTGWRVGYAVFPDPDGPQGELLDDARTRHMLTNVTGSRPAQAAVAHALRNTDPAYYEGVRERLRERIDTFTDALDAIGAPYTDPEGAFYVMAKVPGYDGTFDDIERLIDDVGVSAMPGEAFGRAREEWMRFSLTTDRVDTAAERLIDACD